MIRKGELFQIISRSELDRLYTNKKMSDAEIGKMFGVSGGRIHRLRGKYNIKAVEYYERHPKQVLDQKEKEFLVGTLLGDGHIRCRDKIDKRAYPQLMLEQTTKHFEYIVWLKDQMKEWLFDPNKELKQCRKIHKKTGNVYHSYAFQTICHPVFKEFYKGFYISGKKIVDISFIEKYLSPMSLAVWLMDDGTRFSTKKIFLCSHGFSKNENIALSELLFKKFGIKPNIENSSCKKYWYLVFSKQDSIRITELVKDLVIPSMQYKLISSETTKEADNSSELFEGIVQLQK